MPDELSIKFALDRQQALRGESIFFEVAIQNISGRVLQDVTTLYRQNEALILTLTDAAGKPQEATQKTPARRQGLYSHGPVDPQVKPLPPNQKLELKDDLLGWFGELAPGTYTVAARYERGLMGLHSPPVTFRIQSISPVALDTPRIGRIQAQSPLTGVLLHKFPPTDPNTGKYALFYQQQSQNLPRAPVHMINVAVVVDPVQALAASISDPLTTRGQMIWLDHGQLMMGGVDLETFKPLAPVPVKTPYNGVPIRSPFTRSDGTLLVPFGTDALARRCALLCVAPDGTCDTVDLPLDKHSPLGANVWIWDYESRLHVAWATPGGRELVYRKLPLDDRKAGFSSPTIVNLDNRVLWLDGFMDAVFPRVRTLPGQEVPPPDPVAWVILDSSPLLRCARVNLAHPRAEYMWSFGNQEIGLLSVLDSLVKRDQSLVLLLKDSKSRLYYASTATRQFVPIAEVAKVDLKETQFPALMGAGDDGIAAWVYIRYIDPLNQCIAWVKTEPVTEQDPLGAGASLQVPGR
ncbi:MAG: hypothetical protein ABSH20_14275 [Tepidisphaeraceae bacterium]|jgi:hypothetical protein